jgi:stage V sporulation protein SpoVS
MNMQLSLPLSVTLTFDPSSINLPPYPESLPAPRVSMDMHMTLGPQTYIDIEERTLYLWSGVSYGQAKISNSWADGDDESLDGLPADVAEALIVWGTALHSRVSHNVESVTESAMGDAAVCAAVVSSALDTEFVAPVNLDLSVVERAQLRARRSGRGHAPPTAKTFGTC